MFTNIKRIILLPVIVALGFAFPIAHLCAQGINAQVGKYSNAQGNYKIVWAPSISAQDANGKNIGLPFFENARYDLEKSNLPFLAISWNEGSEFASAQLENAVYEAIPSVEQALFTDVNWDSIPLGANLQVHSVRKQAMAVVTIYPFRVSNGRVERLVSFSLRGQGSRPTEATRKVQSRTYPVNSVLRSGAWFKVGVTRDGLFKIDKKYLQNLGAEVDGWESDKIRVFGNGGGLLPIDNSLDRLNDLHEIPLLVEDGGDGILNADDQILFYAQGPHQWYLNEEGRFSKFYNYQSDTAYYFITTDYVIGEPKRISSAPSVGGTADLDLTTFDDRAFHELDQVNFIKSGRQWFGEKFGVQKSYNFPFIFTNAVIGEDGWFKARCASRAINRSSSYTFDFGQTQHDLMFPTGVVPGYLNKYANIGVTQNTFKVVSSQVRVEVQYNNPSSSDVGWLDYIELNVPRRLQMTDGSLYFRSREALNANIVKFNLSGYTAGLRIMEVTDQHNAALINFSVVSGIATFQRPGGQVREYIAFKEDGHPNPVPFGRVANQDLHGLSSADFLIVSHPDYVRQAERLADFHRDFYGQKVHVVTTYQIYNEFSSGAQDITAIKDFVKMFYDRAGSDPDEMPDYLLLFGDASYDYKYRYPGNTNKVPTYQSFNSTNPTGSYMSDDYFGLLDENEGDALTDKIDIGIGRLPAKTITEATGMVDKIIRYHSKASFGPWRNWLSYVGDDEDGKTHMRQANTLADDMIDREPAYNVEKILFDAYQQVANPGGFTYPDVTLAINNRVEQGGLFITYLGHGGELGWAHERVLGVGDVNSWINEYNMPLFLTATCEFSRFDDPQRTSAGELVLLNQSGGGIALLTTTRLVYSTPNYQLTNEFMEYVFDYTPGSEPKLGDLLTVSKRLGSGVNYRNFTLLGDPAMQLAYPEYTVKTTSVTDTAKALGHVTVKGYVADHNGAKMTKFNGTVYTTVFDKEVVSSTIDNDGIGPYTYKRRNNIIFKGRATVKQGEFEFSFVVPKDISVDLGSGRISYYADNGQVDSKGYYEGFVVGGISDSAAADDQGPLVQLWMNDESFVNGGMTDENPTLIARLEDDNGINTVGTGIGHDIVAILDENTSQQLVLNDYYEADLDSYQSGSLRYALKNLAPGKHTLTLKAWDVHNNSGTSTIEFNVVDDDGLNISHVLNYPNPFTTATSFFFDHNMPGQFLEVRVSIYSVSGKLVKVLDAEGIDEGYRFGPIEWDGLDEFGDKIGRGTYIYKVEVQTPTGERIEKLEKLVVL